MGFMCAPMSLTRSASTHRMMSRSCVPISEPPTGHRCFATTGCASIVGTCDRKSGESTDVMMKMVSGQPHGLFVLDAEPRELNIVLILGPVKMEDLSRLSGIGGLGVLGDLDTDSHGNTNRNKDKDKDKDKTKPPKAKTGGEE